MYDYFHDVREPLPSTLEDPVGPENPRDMNDYFHYDMYHYRRHVNNYFPRRLVAPGNARFKGITAETTPVNECFVV